MRRFSLIPVSILLLAVAGCETTGDPTQGGLLGWSETKAQGRAASLGDQLAYRERLRERAERGRDASAAERSRLTGEVSDTEAELAQLGDDIRRLDALLARDQTKAAELADEVTLLKQTYDAARRSQDTYAARDAIRRAQAMQSDLWKRATASP